MIENQVVIERVIKAPAKFVWEIWTDPALVKLWFGSDPNGIVLSVDMNLVVGGAYRISFQDSDGKLHTAFGEYTEVTPLSKLYCTWQWKSEPGHVTDLFVTFESLEAASTRLTLKHANLNPNSLHGYLEGWNRTLDKIERNIILK